MKPKDSVLMDTKRRILIYFSPCSEPGCNCKGFRPLDIDGSEGSASPPSDPYLTPMEHELELISEPGNNECRTCSHSIGDHADRVANLSNEDVELFHNKIADVRKCCSLMSNASSEDETLHVLFVTMQLLLKSLRLLDDSVVPSFGKPNFEAGTCSPYMVVLKYLEEKYKKTSSEAADRSYYAAYLLLSEMNFWKLPSYTEVCMKAERMESTAYKILLARWEYYVNMPQTFNSLKQYQAVKIFGERTFTMFLKYFHFMFTADSYEPERVHQSDLAEYHSEILTLVNELLEYMGDEDNMEAINKRQDSTGASTIPLRYEKKTRIEDEEADRNDDEVMNEDSKDESEVPRRKRRDFQRRSTSSMSETSISQIRALVHMTNMEKEEKDRLVKLDQDEIDAHVSRGAAAMQEEKNGTIEFRVIRNDLDPFQEREKLVHLVQLQTLFSVQLPKMPKEYITRLVFDDRHQNLVIVKKDKGVIGGICFRQFPTRGFVEIVFCAITAREQVRGYGAYMMNKCKDFQIENKIYHLLTFADEFAIGYFRKQGFSMKLGISKNQYTGFIKEYEGAALMGCQLHPQIQYVNFSNYAKTLRDLHKSLCESTGIYHQGKKFGGIEGLFYKHSVPLPLKKIPGLEKLKIYESPELDDELNYKVNSIIKKLQADKHSWPFLEPVNSKEVPEYYDFIQHPIDLRTMHERLKNKYYAHQHLFIADLMRLFSNCYSFNAVDTEYYRLGYRLNEVAYRLCVAHFPDSPILPSLPDQKPTIGT